MNYVLGIIIIVFSVWGFLSPIAALKYKDRFRIRGDREYTPLAIGMTRLWGFMGIIIGVVIFFNDFY